ncbi:flagellar biosynthetic protein FliR [Sphingosinithalassobacter portus]|uniref:flagellar biosynthetic protein FliR n=1 Tax=Stakelama portus TaxID=2676234 RepID=UPI000D6E759F|nr:flagellar biosynthetic protein FliR [Sphingosinithalassobacter portus]
MQAMGDLTAQAVATLLTSLRIAPMLAFGQPFTLLRMPTVARVMIAMSLSAWLVSGYPVESWQSPALTSALPGVAAGELLLGIALALALQLAFAAIQIAGRTVDIQAGFGLAMLADPTTRNNMPLVGSLFVYAAGAVFFAVGGMQDLLAILAASLRAVPLGAVALRGGPVTLIEFFSSALAIAFGMVGIVLLVLFLLDLILAYLSRTLPQMNVLFIGFQVKALATILVVPLALSASAALFLHLLRAAFDTMTGLF